MITNQTSKPKPRPHLKPVIAEKSSVTRSIAAILGVTQKQIGYLEGDGYLVSWFVGHLIAPPYRL